jgi:hypothetical protein
MVRDDNFTRTLMDTNQTKRIKKKFIQSSLGKTQR